MHDIEHQITYPGSNFIFHDSQGFESGSTEELEIAWKFIEKKSMETELKNQLHAIWYLASLFYRNADLASYRYCIPMDSPRPILPAELEFFTKGTGRGKSYLERLFALNYCYLYSIGQLATRSSST